MVWPNHTSPFKVDIFLPKAREENIREVPRVGGIRQGRLVIVGTAQPSSKGLEAFWGLSTLQSWGHRNRPGERVQGTDALVSTSDNKVFHLSCLLSSINLFSISSILKLLKTERSTPQTFLKGRAYIHCWHDPPLPLDTAGHFLFIRMFPHRLAMQPSTPET